MVRSECAGGGGRAVYIPAETYAVLMNNISGVVWSVANPEFNNKQGMNGKQRDLTPSHRRVGVSTNA